MLSFDPFLYLLSTFRACLDDATIFIVIGYSFHDKYINNLLIQQLSRNTHDDVPKKLIIVNPSFANKSNIEVANELKKIQESKSIEDVINFKQVSPERIKIVDKGAPEFYVEYFADGAKLLMDELEKTESGDQLFE